RRHAVQRATDVATQRDRPIVLYLRSFGDDKVKIRGRSANGRSWLENIFKIRLEEIVVDHLFRYGPVVAIGRPRDKLRRLGAAPRLSDGRCVAGKSRAVDEAGMYNSSGGRTDSGAWLGVT